MRQLLSLKDRSSHNRMNKDLPLKACQKAFLSSAPVSACYRSMVNQTSLLYTLGPNSTDSTQAITASSTGEEVELSFFIQYLSSLLTTPFLMLFTLHYFPSFEVPCFQSIGPRGLGIGNNKNRSFSDKLNPNCRIESLNRLRYEVTFQRSIPINSSFSVYNMLEPLLLKSSTPKKPVHLFFLGKMELESIWQSLPWESLSDPNRKQRSPS